MMNDLWCKCLDCRRVARNQAGCGDGLLVFCGSALVRVVLDCRSAKRRFAMTGLLGRVRRFNDGEAGLVGGLPDGL